MPSPCFGATAAHLRASRLGGRHSVAPLGRRASVGFSVFGGRRAAQPAGVAAARRCGGRGPHDQVRELPLRGRCVRRRERRCHAPTVPLPWPTRWRCRVSAKPAPPPALPPHAGVLPAPHPRAPPADAWASAGAFRPPRPPIFPLALRAANAPSPPRCRPPRSLGGLDALVLAALVARPHLAVEGGVVWGWGGVPLGRGWKVSACRRWSACGLWGGGEV